MASAVNNTSVERTPRDKGDVIVLAVTRYDNGLWHVNGEPCEDRAEVDRVIGNVLDTKLGDRR